ncbi:cation/H(+) antiporter 15-like [Momordica charantia]|uniref:Cation/H(+) antiporter 15-like n=1 Tax=Momordica charantia TaxID=3673 RepID=A0A6J1DQR0_MOMCH|nr:cation/H(+) antiporter 15-like [Momordica charantia]
MGSLIVMEPADVAAYAGGGPRRSFQNLTTICTSTDRVHCGGIFVGSNPLEYSVPLLLMQLGVCSVTILLCSKLLRPLGLPLIVSQIVGGLVLGSSILGQLDGFKETFFPLRGFIFLDIVSSLGSMFYFFIIGVQIDFSVAKKIDTRAFSIGSCSVVLPMILTSIYCLASMNPALNPQIANSFPVVAALESVINFSMVTCFLSELQIINSEIGRIAWLSSVASGFCTICFTLVGIVFVPRSNKYAALAVVYTLVVVAVIIIVLARVVVSRMIEYNPDGQPLKEGYVISLLLGVFVTGVCSQAIGLQVYFGPLVLGMAIPSGPPIGSTLVERFDFVTSWVLMPIFFVKLGWVIDIFIIQLKNFLVLSCIVFVAALGKFLGAFTTSIYFKLPVRDAVLLGLIMNSQGAMELCMIKMLKKQKVLDNEMFSILCLCIVILMAIITPITRYLYDPSRKYVAYDGRTVMHSRPESDFHLLVCVHDQEDVPNAINLLEALNPTRRSHLVVYMLHLVELLGNANPQLISHNLAKVRSSRSCPSEHIVNAFKYFGESNRDIVAIYPFTAISPSATMHDNVCTLALEKGTSLVLVPFHKRFHSNGVMSLCKSKMRTVNNHILDKAPCSVVLVVDRGLLKVSNTIAIDLYTFHLAVVFVGGPDDREAMFIGARMVGHPNIHLTVIRLLTNENVSGDNVEERRLDNEAVSDFREIVAGNCKVIYIEEVVMDSTGTVSILRSMGNNFDIVMVGRRHGPSSPLVQGLVLWNEDTELGAIGEVLVSSDFMGNALILVVNQHTKEFNESQGKHQEVV